MSGEKGATVKGILKNTKSHDQDKGTGEGGIQWDEMNIIMTEHPADKDYGHMKIEEPKTPYHEMMPDEDEPGPSTPPEQQFSPEDLALKVQEASTKPPGEWGGEDMSSGDEEFSEEGKEHKKQFTEWRKKHYNEFYAVKRAKELMKQDEEELKELERLEKAAAAEGEGAMDQGKS